VDDNGYFLPMTSQRNDLPPNTGFLQSRYKLDEVERELRAQIELSRKHLPGRVSHVSAHMGTATATPELRAVTEKLAKEFGLRMESPRLGRTGRWSGSFLSAEQKEKGLVKLLEELQPGTWLIVEHPAFDTPEMRNIGHTGYENVAADRAGVTHAFTSPKVRDVISRRGIKLISYADLPAN
jgi:chitin disaccharide deacetylase